MGRTLRPMIGITTHGHFLGVAASATIGLVPAMFLGYVIERGQDHRFFGIDNSSTGPQPVPIRTAFFHMFVTERGFAAPSGTVGNQPAFGPVGAKCPDIILV